MITLKLDSAELKKALKGARSAGRDFGPALKQFGMRMKRDMIADAFNSQADPATGKKWIPTTAFTLASRAKSGGQTLRDSGRLMQAYMAASVSSDRTSMSVNPGVIVYSAIHQFGGVIRAKSAKGLAVPFNRAGRVAITSRTKVPGAKMGFVRQVTIPARPFLGYSDKHKATLERILLKHLLDGAK